ncbi:MAG: hypothetical protein RLP15_08795 [Cryomorphaceae bacterium]
MTDMHEERVRAQGIKSEEPLAVKEKLMFVLICWGEQSWGRAADYAAKGYERKSREAKTAMYAGWAIYALGITLFVLGAYFYYRS